MLLKPNLLSAAEPDRAVTTHPEVLRAAIRLLPPPRSRPGPGGRVPGLAERRPGGRQDRGPGRGRGGRRRVGGLLGDRHRGSARGTGGEALRGGPGGPGGGPAGEPSQAQDPQAPVFHRRGQEPLRDRPGPPEEPVPPAIPRTPGVRGDDHGPGTGGQARLRPDGRRRRDGGPGARERHPRHLGWLIASRDCLALDWVAAGLVGYEPGDIPYLADAQDRGFLDPGDIEVRDLDPLTGEGAGLQEDPCPP
ncbi:MAG: hypothetical protein M0C28_48615 [Candidatus Moduliflexus flocculans]|nr:hypothetical protein [Candidatus Moduliflexus flocculans]